MCGNTFICVAGFNFGVRQNGNKVGDVELPKWCGGDARLFILAHRAALESDIVREVLPYWIDLVFGFRQTGRPAIEAINVFHPAVRFLMLSQCSFERTNINSSFFIFRPIMDST